MPVGASALSIDTSRVRSSPSCSSTQSENGLRPALRTSIWCRPAGSSNVFGIVPRGAPSIRTSPPAPSALACRFRRAIRGARSSVGEMVVFLRTSSTCSTGLNPDSSRTIFTGPFGTLIVIGV